MLIKFFHAKIFGSSKCKFNIIKNPDACENCEYYEPLRY